MSHLHNNEISCSVCFGSFDIRRAKPVLSTRRLKTHDVFQCPHCAYLVAIPRAEILA